jgi:hypothetical protein
MIGMGRAMPASLALSGLALCASVASAQIAVGRSGSSTQQEFGGQVVWNELAAFGRCYGSTNSKEAMQLLRTRAESPEELAVYRKLFRKHYQSCLGSVVQLNVPYQTVRGAIAEGLYETEVPVTPDLAFSGGLERAQVRNLSDAARCYTAANRGRVKALLADTKLGTKDEAAAVEAIVPGLMQCVPKGARRIAVSPMLVRARLAEALWRLGPLPAPSARAN